MTTDHTRTGGLACKAQIHTVEHTAKLYTLEACVTYRLLAWQFSCGGNTHASRPTDMLAHSYTNVGGMCGMAARTGGLACRCEA